MRVLRHTTIANFGQIQSICPGPNNTFFMHDASGKIVRGHIQGDAVLRHSLQPVMWPEMFQKVSGVQTEKLLYPFWMAPNISCPGGLLVTRILRDERNRLTSDLVYVLFNTELVLQKIYPFFEAFSIPGESRTNIINARLARTNGNILVFAHELRDSPGVHQMSIVNLANSSKLVGLGRGEAPMLVQINSGHGLFFTQTQQEVVFSPLYYGAMPRLTEKRIGLEIPQSPIRISGVISGAEVSGGLVKLYVSSGAEPQKIVVVC